MEAIGQLDRHLTVIVMAQRLSTVRACDYLVEIGLGIVVSKGNFDELVVRSDTVRRMTEISE